MYYTYIIQSDSSSFYYCGQTNKLKDRLIRHNSNRSKSTKGKGPWKLIKYFEFKTRSEAILLERRIKSRGIERFLQEIEVSG